MNEVINYYEDELNHINNSLVLRSTLYLLERAPKYYMEVNAASNPNYCKDRDGNIIKLKEHTKQVARYMILFLSHPTIKSQFSEIDRDLMIAASLVHDLAKYGLGDEPSSYILFEHPILIANLIPEDLKLSNAPIHNTAWRIIEIAIAHNGPWTTNSHSNVILPAMNNNSQFYMHLCDWLASRSLTWIDINADIKGIQ